MLNQPSEVVLTLVGIVRSSLKCLVEKTIFVVNIVIAIARLLYMRQDVLEVKESRQSVAALLLLGFAQLVGSCFSGERGTIVVRIFFDVVNCIGNAVFRAGNMYELLVVAVLRQEHLVWRVETTSICDGCGCKHITIIVDFEGHGMCDTRIGVLLAADIEKFSFIMEIHRLACMREKDGVSVLPLRL